MLEECVVLETSSFKMVQGFYTGNCELDAPE